MQNLVPTTLMRFRSKTPTFRCVQAFPPHFYVERFHRKRIKLKTFLTVDQSAYMSYFSLNGRKHIIKENDDQKYRRRVCLKHAHRVHLTTQREILPFTNVFVWTVGNASKRQCEHQSPQFYSDQTRIKSLLKRLNNIGMASEELYRNTLTGKEVFALFNTCKLHLVQETF